MNTETINEYDENGFLISKSRFNDYLMIYHEIFNKNNITIYKMEIINDDKFEYIDHSEYKNNNTKGNKNIKCNYKNGKLHGEHIEYESNNNFIKIHCNYKNNKLDGDYKEYKCNKLIYHCIYKKNIIINEILNNKNLET